MNHVDDQIWDWSQGFLSSAEEVEVSEHLETCQDCRTKLERELETLASFEQARQQAPAPGATSFVRGLILDDATTLARFVRYVDAVASVADVDIATAQEWLGRIEDEEVWDGTDLEQMHLFHIDGGPAVENAIVGFVRLQPDSGFPEHTHVGDETVVVLQGAIIDEDGVRHGPGSVVSRGPGTTHAINAAPGHPVIYLSVIQEGLDVFGTRVTPDNPHW